MNKHIAVIFITLTSQSFSSDLKDELSSTVEVYKKCAFYSSYKSMDNELKITIKGLKQFTGHFKEKPQDGILWQDRFHRHITNLSKKEELNDSFFKRFELYKKEKKLFYISCLQSIKSALEVLLKEKKGKMNENPRFIKSRIKFFENPNIDRDHWKRK